MSCSSCAYLDASKNKNGGCSGCVYYCKKNKNFVRGCNNSCSDYKSSYRTNYECNKIYNDGRSYSDDTTSVAFYIVVLVSLVILGIVFNVF